MIWILGIIVIVVPFVIISAFVVLEWKTKMRARHAKLEASHDLVILPPLPS